jgi:hypothetical protein
LIQLVIAFFWAVEPEDLIEPDAQLALALFEDEPPPLSEPQAARASAPASVTAAMVAVRLMVTEVLRELAVVPYERQRREAGCPDRGPSVNER